MKRLELVNTRDVLAPTVVSEMQRGLMWLPVKWGAGGGERLNEITDGMEYSFGQSMNEKSVP